MRFCEPRWPGRSPLTVPERRPGQRCSFPEPAVDLARNAGSRPPRAHRQLTAEREASTLPQGPLDRALDQLGRVAQPELALDLRAMGLDGLDAQVQPLRDLACAQ